MHTDVKGKTDMHGTLATIRLTVQGVCLKYDSLQALFQKRYFLIFV